MAQMNFNANQVDGDVKDFSPIPNGKYQAVIVKTEMGKPNDKGTEQLRIEWEVTEGPMAKRHVSNWVTVSCPSSQEAKDIGLRFLKNVCEACGMAGFTDTDELCARPHIIDVGSRKDRQDETKIFNEVKRCYPAGAAHIAPAQPTGTPSAPSASAAPVSQPAQTARPAASSASLPPWARK